MGWVVNATPRPLYAGERAPYPLYKKLDEPQGPVWTDAEYVVSTGFRSPVRPAGSELVYWLRYPGLGFSVSNIYIDLKSLFSENRYNL